MSIDKDFIKDVMGISQTDPFMCYACGRCTAVCPMAPIMDLRPHQIVQSIQVGDSSVLNANAIWYCVSCMACTERCPRNIDVLGLIEALRAMNLRRMKRPLEFRKIKNLEKLPTIALVGSGRKYTL